MSVLNEDAGSLDASATDTLDDLSTDQHLDDGADGGQPAVSSPAAQKDDKSERTVLSVVRDAVREKPAPGGPASSDGIEGDHQQKDPQAQKGGDDEFADVPFHKHPRFQALITERNGFKQAAERYGHLTQFLDENAISGEEAAQALNWSALRKSDPETLWQEMRPFVQTLLAELGEILPPDLRQQVSAGAMTPDVAKQLAKARAQTGIARNQMTFREQQAARQAEKQAMQQTQERLNAVIGAARDWEQAQRGRDPEFHRLYEEIEKEVLFQHSRGKRPDTPEGVKKQLDEALRTVKGRIAGYRGGRRPALNPLTGGSTAGSPQSKPQSVLEAVQRRGSAG